MKDKLLLPGQCTLRPKADADPEQPEWRGYFEERDRKLRDQRPEATSQILQGVCVWFNGRTTGGTVWDLARIVQANGGKTSSMPRRRKITHIVADNVCASKAEQIKREAGAGMIPVVHSSWLHACVEARRKVPVHDFLIVRDKSQSCFTKLQRCERLPSSSPAPLSCVGPPVPSSSRKPSYSPTSRQGAVCPPKSDVCCLPPPSSLTSPSPSHHNRTPTLAPCNTMPSHTDDVGRANPKRDRVQMFPEVIDVTELSESERDFLRHEPDVKRRKRGETRVHKHSESMHSAATKGATRSARTHGLSFAKSVPSSRLQSLNECELGTTVFRTLLTT
eukprot:Rmarinus@m.12025